MNVDADADKFDNDKTTYNFKVTLRNVGREISDLEWEKIEPLHIQLWKRLQGQYKNTIFDFREVTYTIKCDFSQAIDDLRHRYEVMLRLFKQKEIKAVEEFKHQEVDLLFYAGPTSMARCSSVEPATYLVEYLLYSLFLAMNLEAPGSCDLDATALMAIPPDLNIYGKEIKHNISLSNSLFEQALYEYNKFSWLSIKTGSTTKAVKWLDAILPRYSMIPETPVAKSLYALLYLSREGYGPSNLAWIFYALESLFQCRPGENFGVLHRRITSLLALNDKDAATLKRQLRCMYDVRSSFIHGGMTVVHPMQNEVLDERANDIVGKDYHLIQFGFTLIVKCIQIMIEYDIRLFSYSESVLTQKIS